MRKQSMTLIVYKDIEPDLVKCGLIHNDIIQDTIEKYKWEGFVTISDMRRACRVLSGIEYVACDDNMIPCTISGGSSATYLVHPTRVKGGYKAPYISWLQALANSWQKKADNFTVQS